MTCLGSTSFEETGCADSVDNTERTPMSDVLSGNLFLMTPIHTSASPETVRHNKVINKTVYALCSCESRENRIGWDRKECFAT